MRLKRSIAEEGPYRGHVTLEFAGQANGVTLKQPGVDVIRIEGGKIVEVRLFSSDQQQEDLFWGR